MANATDGPTTPGNHGGGHGHDLVTIKINSHPYEVTRGSHTVAELKSLDHVPEADELAEIRHGEVHVLQDTQSVGIQGGEQFLSSPRSSPNS